MTIFSKGADMMYYTRSVLKIHVWDDESSKHHFGSFRENGHGYCRSFTMIMKPDFLKFFR